MATYRLFVPRPAPWRAAGDGLARAGAGMTPLLALYALYTFVRFLLVDRGPEVGPRHAARLLDLEHDLGLGWERAMQGVALDHEWLIRLANWYYVAGFLPVLVLAALVAAWRAPAVFRLWRRVFAVSLLLALAGFALFPVAPPRLLSSDHGFVDTLMHFGPRYYGDAHGSSLFNAYGRIPSMVNEYAAMPSMHVAWSAIAGVLLAAAIGRRWAWSLAVLHPLAMALTVVVTGNHYVLDVVFGLVALGVALLAVRAAAPAKAAVQRRTRPHRTPIAPDLRGLPHNCRPDRTLREAA